MPKKEGETMSRVSFTLTDWDRGMLADLAKHYGVSQSDMVRRLIMIAHTRMEVEQEEENSSSGETAGVL